MYTQIYTYKPVNTLTYTQIDTYSHLHICTLHTRTHNYALSYICIHTYIPIHMNIRAHTYIYTYKHTCIQLHISI